MMVHCKETKDAQRENKVAGLIKTIRKVLKVHGRANIILFSFFRYVF